MVDAYNYRKLESIWRLNRWIQYDWGITLFKNSVLLVIVLDLYMTWWQSFDKKIVNKFYLLASKGMISGQVNNKLHFYLNKNIWIDGGLGDLRIILDVKRTGTKHCMLFIWVYGVCINIHTQTCFKYFQMRTMIKVVGPNYASTCWRILVNNILDLWCNGIVDSLSIG